MQGVSASSRATNKVGDCQGAGKWTPRTAKRALLRVFLRQLLFRHLSLPRLFSFSSRPLHLSLGGKSHSFSGMLSSPCHGPLGHIGRGLDPPPPVSLEPIN